MATSYSLVRLWKPGMTEMGFRGLLHPRGERAWVVIHQHTLTAHFPALPAATGVMSVLQEVWQGEDIVRAGCPNPTAKNGVGSHEVDICCSVKATV